MVFYRKLFKLRGLMILVYVLISIYIGGFLGYFLQAKALIGITLICLAINVYLLKIQEKLTTSTEIILLFIPASIIINVAMWISYYHFTNQTWAQVFAHKYLLR